MFGVLFILALGVCVLGKPSTSSYAVPPRVTRTLQDDNYRRTQAPTVPVLQPPPKQTIPIIPNIPARHTKYALRSPSTSSTQESLIPLSKPPRNFDYRQLPTPGVPIPAPTTSSSYDYWWPYPPAGQTTPTPPSLIQTTDTTPTLTFPFYSSPATLPPDPLTSAPSTTANLPTNTTESIISITALPPLSSALPTPVTHRKNLPPSQHKFKLVYLAPVFALLGVLLGSATAWIVYGCLTRRPRLRAEDREVGGPRYTSVSGDVEGQGEDEDARENREVPERVGGFSWPGVEGEKPAHGRESDGEDPFLVPAKSTRLSKTGSKSKYARTGDHSPVFSDTTSLALLELYGNGEDEDKGETEEPWESLRHKSIKRGILERVQEDSWVRSLRGMRGSTFVNAVKEEEAEEVDLGIASGSSKGGDGVGKRMKHGRTDSDLCIGDVKTPERNGSSRTTVRADSTRTTSCYEDTERGFRIVEESPVPPLLRTRTLLSSLSKSSAGDADPYTPLPVRTSRSQSSRSSSPVKGISSRANTGVLPQSPPQIMSPPLESKLYFTPTPGSSAQMPASSRRTVPYREYTTPTKSSRPTTAAKGGRGKKLHSPHPPALPFPVADPGINSPRPGVYRGRLLKAARDKSLPMRPASARADDPSTSSIISPSREEEENRVRSDGALRKVEEIVERSWSTRDLGGEAVRSLSPTRFGRHV